MQLLMESDVAVLIGAGRYERSGERTTWRNGYRDRTIDTQLGSLQLIAVIQEAWIGGLSTRWCRRWVCPGSASETVRSWVLKFGPMIARRLRRRRPCPRFREGRLCRNFGMRRSAVSGLLRASRKGEK